MKFKMHPACSVWPEMLGPELAALADDIFENGLREPLTLTPDGLLLDGRNRALACGMAGVEPTTVVYDGDPVLFSLSKNKRRRHMDAVDLDRVAAEMATAPHGGACYKIDGSNEPSIADAAEAVGRPETAVKAAKTVLTQGTEEEKKAVFVDKTVKPRAAADAIRARKKTSPITAKTRDTVREKLENDERVDRNAIAVDLGVHPRNVDNAIAVEKARLEGRAEVEQVNAGILSETSQARLERFKQQELAKLQFSFEDAVNAEVKKRVAAVLAKRDATALEAIEHANQVLTHLHGRLRPPFSAPEYMVLMRALHPDSSTQENRLDAFKLCNNKKFLLREEGKIAKPISTMPRTVEELEVLRAAVKERRRTKQ